MATRNLTPTELGDLARHLQAIRSVVITAIGALRGQRADIDNDVAAALQCGVADPLSVVAERLDPSSTSTLS